MTDGFPNEDDIRGVHASLKAAQNHGYARFGHYGSINYVHYDHKAPGGSEAALHALKELRPKLGSPIIITHKPWPTKADRTFNSQGQAAVHIRKLQDKP